MSDKLKKWNEAYQDADIASALPVQVLEENAFLLPESGLALDLACGRGGNSLFLAHHEASKLEIDSIDLSPVVLDKLSAYAKQKQLPINCTTRDIEVEGLLVKHYDVIVVSYFLDRDLFPDIIDALKPAGLLFYQTWAQDKVDESGPNNPRFRLAPSELLTLSHSLIPILYRENGRVGDVTKGLRNEAMLIARKAP